MTVEELNKAISRMRQEIDIQNSMGLEGGNLAFFTDLEKIVAAAEAWAVAGPVLEQARIICEKAMGTLVTADIDKLRDLGKAYHSKAPETIKAAHIILAREHNIDVPGRVDLSGVGMNVLEKGKGW